MKSNTNSLLVCSGPVPKDCCCAARNGDSFFGKARRHGWCEFERFEFKYITVTATRRMFLLMMLTNASQFSFLASHGSCIFCVVCTRFFVHFGTLFLVMRNLALWFLDSRGWAMYSYHIMSNASISCPQSGLTLYILYPWHMPAFFVHEAYG